MPLCFFVSDLHGHTTRYRKLFGAIEAERPETVLLGGDLFPSGLLSGHALEPGHENFVESVLAAGFEGLRERLGAAYPRVFIILGNDDPRFEEAAILDLATGGLWEYVHNRKVRWRDLTVYGYANVPPTPFRLKDWERYDVSRFVDPGSISPEEGFRSVPAPEGEVRWRTIAMDLEELVASEDASRAVFLFHAPPYRTLLDRAGLDGRTVDHAPLDVHVGSIAIRRFIEARQPLATLHGHVHESARLTGAWRDRIGRTVCLSAAHDGPELALVRFDLQSPAGATRELL
jgi:uncharacterized protein